MRLLICSERAPVGPPNGGRLVLRALLRQLIQRHDVRLICVEPLRGEADGWMSQVPLRVADLSHRELPTRYHPGDASWADTRLRAPQVIALARAVATGRPMYLDRLARAMRGPLQEELETFRPDLVHVATAALGALGRDLDLVPSVITPLDAEHKNIAAAAARLRGVRRVILLNEVKRMRRFEAVEYARFSRVIVVSDEDRAALHLANPRLSIHVIPNGVDLQYFAPREVGEVNSSLVFHGVMSHAPNVDAAEYLVREVLPIVQGRHPGVELVIVGRAPTRQVVALAGHRGVTVTGAVTDLRRWLVQGAVYVCPMRSGTGIKNKLLEAMACGLPCVVTPLALAGLRAVPERDVLVASTAKGIAAQIQRLIEDHELRNRLGAAARHYVEHHHDWGTVALRYEAVYHLSRGMRADQLA